MQLVKVQPLILFLKADTMKENEIDCGIKRTNTPSISKYDPEGDNADNKSVFYI